MAKINFEDKEDVKLSSLPRKNKIIATDINEIKQSVNDLYDEKQDNLVSGENLSTVNGQSLLTGENIPIPPPVWGGITGTLSDQTDLQNALNAKQDALVSGVNIRTINSQSLLGSTDIVINSENIYTDNGTIGAGRVVTLTDTLSFSGGRVSFDTTTDGILLPRVTTAQMNAIASPATHLLVFNTDLNGLYRYNGSAWVALSAGYGIIEVRDASGYPTFYADLQTAINATSDKDTVYIHSDIQVTSVVNIPQRSSLTFQMNGRRLWTDTSGGDFNLFRVTANSGNPQRHLRFEGGGIFEQTGTIVSGVNSAILYAVNIGTTPLEIYAGTTIFRAENALVMNSNGFDLLEGGYLISTNSAVNINADVNNSYWDCYESCQLPTTKKIKNCILKTRYGGYFAPLGGGEIENCHIEGDVTKSGNYGLLYANGSRNVRNCFLRQTHATGRDALYVKGSGSGGDISNNVCINMGTGYGGNFTYGASSNNYFYSAGGIALYSEASSTRFNDNVCISNSSTLSALYCQGTIITNNTAINLNASNPQPAMYVGRNTGTCEIYGNRAEVANAFAFNWRFLFAGATTYYAYNIMGRVGLGLNPTGAPANAMVNTPDAYGNLKIG